MPRISGSKVACSPLAFFTRAFSRSRTTLSTSCPGSRSVSAGGLDPYLLHHLANDQLDVLVMDVHALRPVHALHLVDEVDLDLRGALEAQKVSGSQRALVEGVAGLDDLALGDQKPGAPWDQVRNVCERLALLVDPFRVDRQLDRTLSLLQGDGAADLGELRSPLRYRASKISTTRGRPCVMSAPATPPVWNVRIVSWVPGSPIDCAAMIPTASPISHGFPVARNVP